MTGSGIQNLGGNRKDGNDEVEKVKEFSYWLDIGERVREQRHF